MKVETSSVGDDRNLDSLVEIANESVVRAIRAIHDAIDGVRAGDPKSASEIAKHMADLNKALNISFEERKRLDDHKRKTGELGGGELDLGAARSQILDGLGRLRAARGSGPISQ